MEQNNIISMHAQAKQNTEDSLAYLIYQQHAKTEELNKLAETVLKDAKMELYIAQLEGVKYDSLSSIAQRLHDSPNLQIKNRFRGKAFLLEDGLDTPLQNDATMDQEATFDEMTEENVTYETATSTQEPEAKATPAQPKPEAIVKSFCKLQPAHSVELRSKTYRVAVLKPAREVVKATIDQFVQQQLSQFVAEFSDENSGQKPTFKGDLQTYTLISSMYDAVLNGKSWESFGVPALSYEAEAVRDLDTLAYTIVANAEQFREDNPALTDGQKLTASNIKQYYRELGKSESTEDAKRTGAEVIMSELADDVAEIMTR